MDMNEEKLKDIKSFKKNSVHAFISLRNVCIVLVLPPEGSCDSLPVIQLSKSTTVHYSHESLLIYFTWPGVYKQFM